MTDSAIPNPIRVEQTARTRAAIAMSGYSMGVAAQRLGLSKSGLSRRLAGKTEWTLPELRRLCELTHMSADYFIFPEGRKA